MATAKQITQGIIDWYLSTTSEAEADFQDAWSEFIDELEWNKRKEGIEIPFGKALFLKSVGGEGEGEKYWVLFQVEEEFFKIDGYFNSWDGVNWEGSELYKVTPVEVTVIEYQKVDE